MIFGCEEGIWDLIWGVVFFWGMELMCWSVGVCCLGGEGEVGGGNFVFEGVSGIGIGGLGVGKIWFVGCCVRFWSLLCGEELKN